MKTIGEAAVEFALQSVGVKEETSNWGKYVSVYLKFVGIDYPAPWCMAFVTYKIHQAAESLGKQSLLPKTGVTAASCTSLYHYAVSRNLLLKAPERGCIFLVRGAGKFVHTGLVTSVEGDRIHTVEGNTNNDGSSNGDGVYARSRKASSCVYVKVV
jgi:hypothetical protein